MRSLIFLFIILFITSASALTANAKAPCKMIDDTTLSLHAEIEENLVDCMKSLNFSKLETVVLNSVGGNVEAAMTVGDMIAPYQPHMIIKEHCHSSCSNYWLPLARKITFSKKAYISIHGGFDSGILKLALEREQENIDKIKIIVDLQANYIKRHNIPRGWVMYRTDYQHGKNGLKAFSPWLKGEFYRPKTQKKVIAKFFMVAKPMLDSCLPDIEIDGFEQSYAGRADDKRWRKLAKKGHLSTGTVACPAETVSRQ